MSRLDTLDPKDFSIVANNITLTGFADAKIEVERDNNLFEDESGPDGDVVRWNTNDRRGVFRVALLQTSRSNAILSAFHKSDETNGNTVFPVVVQDNRGTDIHQAAFCWIRKMPVARYIKGQEARVWEIRTNNLQMFLGGAA